MPDPTGTPSLYESLKYPASLGAMGVSAGLLGYGLGGMAAHGTDAMLTSDTDAYNSQLPKADPKVIEAMKAHMGLPDVPVLPGKFNISMFAHTKPPNGTIDQQHLDHVAKMVDQFTQPQSVIAAKTNELVRGGMPPDKAQALARQQLIENAAQHGYLWTPPTGINAGQLAHELGHAKSRADGTFVNTLNSDNKWWNKVFVPGASAAAGALTGAATGSPLYGALAGAGTGLIGSALTDDGSLAEEYRANSLSNDALREAGGLDKDQLRNAYNARATGFGTYVNDRLTHGVLGGAAAGLIGAGARNLADTNFKAAEAPASLEPSFSSPQDVLKALRDNKVRFAMGASYPMRHIREPGGYVANVHNDDFGKALKAAPGKKVFNWYKSGPVQEVPTQAGPKVMLYEGSHPKGFGYNDLEPEGYDVDQDGNQSWTLDQMVRQKQQLGRSKDKKDLGMVADWAESQPGREEFAKSIRDFLASKQRPSVIEGVGEKSPILKSLLKAKAYSDKKDWKGKHGVLAPLMAKYPDQFSVDSQQGDILGVTHDPSRFRIHSPRKFVPDSVYQRYAKSQVAPSPIPPTEQVGEQLPEPITGAL